MNILRMVSALCDGAAAWLAHIMTPTLTTVSLSTPPVDCVYPNGSVPDSDDRDDPAQRVTRWACASVNHHPRNYDGSWCMGYGYVCRRCGMYADPWPAARLQQVGEEANRRQAEGKEFYLGDLCRRWRP